MFPGDTAWKGLVHWLHREQVGRLALAVSHRTAAVELENYVETTGNAGFQVAVYKTTKKL